MAHPFFDGGSYPWHRRDAQDLYRGLWQTITDGVRVEYFYQSTGPGLLPLAPGAADVMWKQALDALAGARRIRELCELLVDDDAVSAIKRAVLAVQNAEDPIEKRILSDDRLFIDRRPLRDKLQRFAVSSSIRVLLVRGGADSGKSWTRHLVTQLADALGEPTIYLFEGLVSTVDETIEQLFAALGDLSLIPPRLETEDAWFRKVCVRLQMLGQARGRTLWVVIDDLGVDERGPRLDPMIRQFFEQFAASMANPLFAKWFRLVLIDYPDLERDAAGRRVPTRWKDFWDEDRPEASDVQANEVADFFLEWASAKERQLAPADAAKLAADIIASADAAAGTKPRLERIHDAVLAALPHL